MGAWRESEIHDQHGRTVVITGANSGLGLRAATVLAAKGARVILACRSRQRGERAAAAVGGELVLLDLADQDRVRSAAADIRDRTGDRVDLLINNAGIPAGRLRRTAAGHESILATNHLGHAALTWLLMPALRAGDSARVVAVSSIAHRGKGFDVDDLGFERRRFRMAHAYAQSKLAVLMFALELQERLRAEGSPVLSVAAHPGFTGTEIAAAGARNQGLGAVARPLNALTKAVSQSVPEGTIPVLYAATAPDVLGGGYYGPRKFGEFFRGVGPARVDPRAQDRTLRTRLWDRTAELTGVRPDPA
ncbi:SDR family NAD(P)-dependent oxidoreductase [Labedaea rhizosphaerae]|uniref:Protochlorophyllide reductase n=1 Tax=Labedaea rhizosphaerae TaxID=598644 RepID=A0A4R6S0C6_LABRH|nr:SDR family NAD(P)-dependent oxidoreductase [Labedaea rhizosphaerae]TDP92949.1 protochlorophyllide reductase [Labedaea rhizosphaerae]